MNSWLFSAAQLAAILLGGIAGVLGTFFAHRDKSGRLTTSARLAIATVVLASVASAIAVVLDRINDAATQQTVIGEIRRGLTPITKESFRLTAFFELDSTVDPYEARRLLADGTLGLQVTKVNHSGQTLVLDADFGFRDLNWWGATQRGRKYYIRDASPKEWKSIHHSPHFQTSRINASVSAIRSETFSVICRNTKR